MGASRFRQGRRIAVAASAVSLVFGGWLGAGRSPAAADAVSTARCAATRVHYRPYEGVQNGLAPIPWIAALPSSTGLVGHLFYYDGFSVWKQKELALLRIYTGGQSPDGRVSMKILWELRHGSAPGLRIEGRRLDGTGSFTQRLDGGGVQFPSIVNVPSAGCWRLTLTAGKVSAKVIAIAVPGKKS